MISPFTVNPPPLASILTPNKTKHVHIVYGLVTSTLCCICGYGGIFFVMINPRLKKMGKNLNLDIFGVIKLASNDEWITFMKYVHRAPQTVNNFNEEDGRTPLMEASVTSNVRVCKELLRLNANVFAVDHEQRVRVTPPLSSPPPPLFPPSSLHTQHTTHNSLSSIG